jgi:hypothetical protein
MMALWVSNLHVRLPQSFGFLRIHPGLRLCSFFLALGLPTSILTLGAFAGIPNYYGDSLNSVSDVVSVYCRTGTLSHLKITVVELNNSVSVVSNNTIDIAVTSRHTS